MSVRRPHLGAIDGLKDALARLRKFGGPLRLGFQSMAQVFGEPLRAPDRLLSALVWGAGGERLLPGKLTNISIRLVLAASRLIVDGPNSTRSGLSRLRKAVVQIARTGHAASAVLLAGSVTS